MAASTSSIGATSIAATIARTTSGSAGTAGPSRSSTGYWHTVTTQQLACANDNFKPMDCSSVSPCGPVEVSATFLGWHAKATPRRSVGTRTLPPSKRHRWALVDVSSVPRGHGRHGNDGDGGLPREEARGNLHVPPLCEAAVGRRAALPASPGEATQARCYVQGEAPSAASPRWTVRVLPGEVQDVSMHGLPHQ